MRTTSFVHFKKIFESEFVIIDFYDDINIITTSEELLKNTEYRFEMKYI